MIKQIEGAKAHVLAIEIIDGYKHEDEKSLEKMFEERLDAGIEKVNMLVKIDSLKIIESSLKAMWEDGVYAMKHIKHCGRIAVVGDSKVEEFLVKTDNAIFGNKKTGRIEKYFFTDQMEQAMEFVNG